MHVMQKAALYVKLNFLSSYSQMGVSCAHFFLFFFVPVLFHCVPCLTDTLKY